MSFLAPGWIALAAGAALAVAVIHLIAWRLPRTVLLPTARFVPGEPARRAARTIRPADLALLALRVGIIMTGGLALARPRQVISPSGAATVIAVERSAAIGDTAALHDSVRALPTRDHASFVVFDSTARVFADAGAAIGDASAAGATRNASLTVGLIAAIREARRLSRDYETVDIVLVSTLSRSLFDRATSDVREAWGDSIRVVRIPVAARAPQPPQVEIRAARDDAVSAAIRLAESHGLLQGASRVVRDTEAAADSAWVTGGRVLVVWPRSQAGAVDRVDGVHTDGATAIGYFVRTTTTIDSGVVVARWVDGTPAAVESSLGTGCRRDIGFDVRDVGDFVLTPSFQRLLPVLLGPCGGNAPVGVAEDSVVASLVSPPSARGSIAAPDESAAPNKVAALLMTLAVLLAMAELAVRRSVGTRPAGQLA